MPLPIYYSYHATNCGHHCGGSLTPQISVQNINFNTPDCKSSVRSMREIYMIFINVMYDMRNNTITKHSRSHTTRWQCCVVCVAITIMGRVEMCGFTQIVWRPPNTRHAHTLCIAHTSCLLCVEACIIYALGGNVCIGIHTFALRVRRQMIVAIQRTPCRPSSCVVCWCWRTSTSSCVLSMFVCLWCVCFLNELRADNVRDCRSLD